MPEPYLFFSPTSLPLLHHRQCDARALICCSYISTSAPPHTFLNRRPIPIQNLNPVWGGAAGAFIVAVHDLHVQCLRVTVVDSDWGLGRDDPLGHCEVRR
jgi:hypothetical protein